jgi:hypothetical protein
VSNPDQPSPPPSAAPDPRTAEIRRAEWQLLVLDRIVELSMELAEALQAKAIAEARTPVALATEPTSRPLTKDPGETFNRVTRAVRLTLAMQMSLEKTIRNLREASSAEAKPGSTDEDSVENRGTAWIPGYYRKHHSETNDGSRTDRVRDLVWDVANHDIHDLVEAQETLSALHERLKETETYDGILYRPLKETVEAVCADLGLTPDWSRWTGDGWLPPTSGHQWQTMWARPEPGLRAPSPPPAPRPHGPGP